MTRHSFITLANSIIGVSVLSIPFTFQKCGILLSILMLLLSNYVTRICCNFLLKCSIITRRKNFEGNENTSDSEEYLEIPTLLTFPGLGFHAFGSSGKILVELCVIGYLMGTCVAFFVVIGDLCPEILGKFINLSASSYKLSTIRIWLMIFVTVVLVLPLSFQKNVDSLSFVCSASIGFYVCLVLKTISESTITLNMDKDWMSNVAIWKPSGLLQCLPIFSMSLSCQMQLFEVYETFPFQSLEKMYQAVKAATSICCTMYICIGFFGYVAFYNHELSGNILVNFSPSMASDAIKIGFVLSVACSIPLIVLPCRNCLNSFLQKRTHSDAAGYLPESKYRPLTLFVVFGSMFLGILIPSIEIVIGLIGSTIGIIICVIFPAATFIKITKRNTTEKLIAQIMITIGFIVMILGTYANLAAMDVSNSGSHLEEKHEMFAKLIETEKPSFKFEQKLDFQDQELPKIEKPKDFLIISEKVDKQDTQDKLEMIKSKLKESDANKLKMKNVVVPPQVVPETEKPLIINKDAILKEEREIAIERQSNEAEIKKLKETKEILENEVKEMKEELVKQNQETQKLVLQKFEEIEKKVDSLVEKKEEEAKVQENLENEAKVDGAGKLEEPREEIVQKIPEETKEIIKEPEKLVEPPRLEDLEKVEEIKLEALPEISKNSSQIEEKESDPIIKMLKNSYDKNMLSNNEPLSYQVGENFNQKKLNITDILKPEEIKKEIVEEKPEMNKILEKQQEEKQEDQKSKADQDDSKEIHNEIRRKRDVDQEVCENENLNRVV